MGKSTVITRITRFFHKKEDSNMPMNKVLKKKKVRITPNDYSKKSHNSAIREVKRVGKSIVVVGIDGAKKPITPDFVRGIKTEAIVDNAPVTIKASGLSRAQIGRIVSDLKTDSINEVFVRRLPSKSTGRVQATSYEILITGGKEHE